MSILLDVEGIRYTQFISAAVERRLDALCDQFSFSLSAPRGEPLPFKGGEECSIYISNQLALTGEIEVISASYSNADHVITISGRDSTKDILDSTLDSFSDLSAPITLKQIIEKVIAELGLGLFVIDRANPEAFNRAEDIVSPEPGENAFSFIEKYTRKRQVLLSSDPEGNVVIDTAEGQFVNNPIRNIIGFNGNNVLDGNVSYDLTGRYNKYKMVSAGNPSALIFAGIIPVNEVADQQGEAIDDDIPAGRQLILNAEASASNGQSSLRAQWEANIRKTRSRVYAVTVDDHVVRSGELWDTNKLISVVDNFAGINSRMLTNTIAFKQNLTEGNVTTIGFVDQNAYTLSLQEPKGEKIGEGFIV